MSSADKIEFWGAFKALNGTGPSLAISQSDGYPVKSLTLSIAQLENCWTVWYQIADQKWVGLNEVDAQPVKVAEVALEFDAWPADKVRDGVNWWERKLTRGCSPGTLLGYALPDEGAPLLLDGNHRAVALVRVKMPLQVNVLVLDGPTDVSHLPDLKHHKP